MFQGNPVKIFALIQSAKAKPLEKRRTDLKFRFKNGPTITVTNEKNKLRNIGIKISANGIKILKLSSKVNEFVIQ